MSTADFAINPATLISTVFALHSGQTTKPRSISVQNAAVQPDHSEYLSIADVARRWRCSRGTVYNRLRAAGAKVLTFSPCGKRSKKGVSIDVVQQIETRNTRRLC